MMGGQAVLFTPAVGLALLRALALVLPLLPAALLRRAAAVSPAGGRARTARRLAIVAVLCGALFAPALLWATLGGDIAGFDAVFAPDGPWHLGFGGFVLGRALPLLGAPLALLGRLAAGTAPPDIARSSLLLGAAALLPVLGPALVWGRRGGAGAGLRNLLLLLWGGYATIYAVALVLWLANLLNFWCFLVLFALTLLLRD